MPTTKKPTTSPKSRTLLATRLDDSEFKITIPATAKVTMAAGLNPTSGQHGWGHAQPCLRIYEGVKQTGCFVGIKEFRDLGYEFTEKLTITEEAATRDSRGNYQGTRKVSVANVQSPF